MSAIWTGAEAAVATGGTTGDWEAYGVSIDTRTLQAGDLFVALKAARDGHDFVAQALEKGAAAALVSRVPEGVEDTDKLLLVNDVLAGLEALGEAARARTAAQVIAVTGSAGKTSTKEMLRAVLEREGRCHAAEASYNNHWGVPLTLARMPRETDFAVIEIGMNHPGEIAPLARMARPHVALITTVAAAHLAAFDGIEGIAEEKAAIFEGLVAGGTAIWNGDVSTAGILEACAREKAATCQSFGAQSQEYLLKALTLGADSTRVEAAASGEAFEFTIGASGRHFAMNGLGAIAACVAVGVPLGAAADSLAAWAPPAGRGERQMLQIGTSRIELIDDAFNANPASMEASLQVLADIPQTKGRKIAILGDMLEIGHTENAQHADIASLSSIEALDKVYCVGPLMHHCWEALDAAKQGGYYGTADTLAAEIRDVLEPEDIVLVKGSKGIAVSKIVTAIKDAAREHGQEQGTA